MKIIEARATSVQLQAGRHLKQLNLLRPIYSKTTNYGHFGKIDDRTYHLGKERTKSSRLLRKPQLNVRKQH